MNGASSSPWPGATIPAAMARVSVFDSESSPKTFSQASLTRMSAGGQRGRGGPFAGGRRIAQHLRVDLVGADGPRPRERGQEAPAQVGVDGEPVQADRGGLGTVVQRPQRLDLGAPQGGRGQRVDEGELEVRAGLGRAGQPQQARASRSRPSAAAHAGSA